MKLCPFCEEAETLEDDVVASNEHCLLIRACDPVLQSSLMIIPRRHVETPFDLSVEEWLATHALLTEARRLLDVAGPDGYSIGWNVHAVGGQSVSHAHLHVIARFEDEPLAGQGIRHALKQPANMRKGCQTGEAR